MKVAIGVPTFKRPIGLKTVLDSISELKLDPDVSVVVIVADNEGSSGAGMSLVASLAENFPYSLTAIPVPERGISQVRNALMKHAFFSLKVDGLAMVDDDEIVAPEWLQSFIEMQKMTGADVVGGAVLPKFENSMPPSWSIRLPVYFRPIEKQGIISLVQSTTSVFFARSIVEKFPNERFDTLFSTYGGGDKEYFTRIKRLGAVFAFQPKSVSYEIFGKSRATLKWALERNYRIGAGDARLLRQESMFVQLKGLAIACVAILLSIFSCLIFFWSPERSAENICRFARQIGKFSGAFGHMPEVYKKIHGS